MEILNRVTPKAMPIIKDGNLTLKQKSDLIKKISPALCTDEAIKYYLGKTARQIDKEDYNARHK